MLFSEQRLKQQLDTSNKHLRSILKTVSHDIRNYIAGVSGLASLISEDEKPTQEGFESYKELATMMADQSKQMIDFAQEILDIDENGMIKRTRDKQNQQEQCDVGLMVSELLFLNRDFIKDCNVAVATNIATNLPLIQCQKINLRQILENLITNAAKYSKKGGEVKISCQVIDHSDSNYNAEKNNSCRQIYVTIADNGIGMAEKDIKKALDGEGKNIDKSALDKPFDSHGIGLPNVVQAVDKMGALMNIESKKNEGTIVKLWFDCV